MGQRKKGDHFCQTVGRSRTKKSIDHEKHFAKKPGGRAAPFFWTLPFGKAKKTNRDKKLAEEEVVEKRFFLLILASQLKESWIFHDPCSEPARKLLGKEEKTL
jgi:hypothetical protein